MGFAGLDHDLRLAGSEARAADLEMSKRRFEKAVSEEKGAAKALLLGRVPTGRVRGQPVTQQFFALTWAAVWSVRRTLTGAKRASQTGRFAK